MIEFSFCSSKSPYNKIKEEFIPQEHFKCTIVAQQIGEKQFANKNELIVALFSQNISANPVNLMKFTKQSNQEGVVWNLNKEIKGIVKMGSE